MYFADSAGQSGGECGERTASADFQSFAGQWGPIPFHAASCASEIPSPLDTAVPRQTERKRERERERERELLETGTNRQAGELRAREAVSRF